MKLQHTNGPWSFTPEYGRVYGKSPSGYPVAVCEAYFKNGNLIAAAPDMLEALRAMYVAYSGVRGVNREALEMCKDAIAKAQGYSWDEVGV
jgi:hypothetical protein